LYAPEAVFVAKDGRTITDRTEIAAQSSAAARLTMCATLQHRVGIHNFNRPGT
jgi:hypothetical protein